MLPSDPCAAPAHELVRAYRQRELSPVEVTRALFARIARLNGRINAFVVLDEESALSAARASTDPPWLVGAPPHVGPIARSVEDIARALSIIAAPDARDPFRVALQSLQERTGSTLRGVRIAFTAELVAGRSAANVDPEILAAFERAIAALRTTGAEIEAASPKLRDPEATLRKLFTARAASTLASLSSAQGALVDPTVLASAEQGAGMSAVEYLEVEGERIGHVQRMAEFHQRYDLLLTPTTSRVAPLVNEQPPLGSSFAAPFSLTRQPALSLPCGHTRAGLPIGLQMVGRHGEEALLLRAARALEQLALVARPAIVEPEELAPA